MKKYILLLALFITTNLVVSQDIIMDNGIFSQCSGMFYDSGTQYVGYGSNENYVATICADVAGSAIQLDFSFFFIGSDGDEMKIYDGDGITAPLIGTYVGGGSPGIVSASDTNTSGCLTVEFISNASGTNPGWEASVNCFTPCQTITASIDNVTPVPDASGVVEVDPGDLVTFEGSAIFSDDGTGATYTWDFGNGDTLDGLVVNYAYPTPGTYTVTLTVTDTNIIGCSDSDSSIQVFVLDNDACVGSLPICGDLLNIPSPVGEGTAQAGIDYGCLGSQPRPRWYFMQTGDIAGDLSFTLTQNSGQNGTGTGNDVDFILWGPFDQPECGPSSLNASTQVDCSFSASATEDIFIPDAPANSYYVLLVTNYSQSAGYINLVSNDLPGSDATTNCDIICKVDLGEDQELCSGGDYTIISDNTGAFNTFEWQKDGVPITGETTSSLTVTESGTYTLLAEGLDAVYGDPCSAQDEIVISIGETFVLNDISVSECSGTATSAIFNLDNEIVNILSPLSVDDYVVSFHEDLTSAEDNSSPISDSDSYTGTEGQIIYVRAEIAGVAACFSTSTITLAISEAPIINPVSDMSICDDDSNDGFSTFELSDQTATILGSQLAADFEVTYYLTAEDADLGNNALPLTYTNTANPQPIYVRVTSIADTDCYATSVIPLFNLIVNTRALATAPIDLDMCDDLSGDGVATFNLSNQETTILGGQDASVFNVSFHASQDDAENNVGILPTSYENTSSPNQQTIYVRVEDPLYPSCYATTSFDLIVNSLPVITDPSALEVCDDGTPDGLTEMDLTLKNSEITGDNPDYIITYHELITEAELGTNPLPLLYTNTSNGQFIFARVEDANTGCYVTTRLELVVQQAPIAYTPQPLIYCDPDNDGLGIFILSDLDTEITGGASGLDVTYHETQINADDGVNAIDTSVDYENIVQDAQTLYARIESSTITTACATIVVVELIVEETPQLIAPSALEVCDDVSADGYAIFDLSTKSQEVLNGQNETQYILSYYVSEADAESASNPITNYSAYTNTDAFNQIIWIRAEDNTTAGGCYKTISLELIVNPLPVLNTPAPLELCDVNNPGDEQEAFTLEDANNEILNGQTGLTLTYYETLLDAESATNAIASPYVNTGNDQIIFVRAENDTTGCYNTVTVTLHIDPVPSPEPNPTAIEVCDDNNDGFAEFDLTQRTTEITNSESDVEITYHESEADAETGDNAITGLYTNTVANNQMIYVRSENTLTGCYSLTENTLELIVVASPEVPTAIAPYVLCDTDANGFTQFDLTTKDAEIIGAQDVSAISLTYHINEAEAETGANPIININSFTNTVNPQTIYVRLFNASLGCEDTGEFQLEVNLPPVAIQPTQLSLCDDLGETPGDEFTVFDLTVKDDEITGGNGNLSVAYYETNADAQSQINVIEDPTQYTNTSVDGLNANPQTLYVVVTDTNTGCVDYVTLTIRVLPNPTPTPSEDIPNITLCDDVNTGDGVEIFDLTENEVLILNGEAGVTASYYETQEDANTDSNEIPDPTQYTNIDTPEQEIYVRITRNSTGCYSLVDFTIVVHPLPTVVPVTDFIQCELFTDGIDSFDLTTKDEEVLDGQDATQFIVSYHESLADAEAGMNGLVSSYSNTSNPQEIFVTITNNVTGCSISTQSFYIEVHEAAQANPDTNPILYEICDDEIDGDYTNGSAQFDLTTMDADILDLQDPLNYIVTYYGTQEDADLKENPLPTLYENTVNPQVIYARVDNDTPDAITGNDTSICYAVAELTLEVNPLPDLDLDDSYILCINTNDTEVLEPLVIDTYLSAVDYTFVWYFNAVEMVGETGPSIVPLEEGTYSVDVTDVTTSSVTSCVISDSTEVIESEPPSITIELLTQAFADNHVLEATAIGIGVYEFSLDGGPWQDSGIFSNVSSGDHEITARDRNGCGLRSTSKFVLDYPLFFTPNGDGNNETWNIEGIGDSAEIYIYDRYGKLLQQVSPDGDGWDGTYNGKLMPTDGYWFTVEYDEPSTGERKEFKAHFSLKR
ncbi:T9SS type B sorting domain-containing protein [Winogradskyella undariae]|uniref:T9SS type B sorting domain-containing protein n=1 Tax=Winogradskyella undariae TaxID=1285465 RepID=UPI00156B1790|nr:T9SS type B sorting domain-containing protein [Winogradskyella undariae]NRR91742.1 T9SS type B sorting domain-containing protein [Winogradskyella undariae]